jgi:hypothetical protein
MLPAVSTCRRASRLAPLTGRALISATVRERSDLHVGARVHEPSPPRGRPTPAPPTAQAPAAEAADFSYVPPGKNHLFVPGRRFPADAAPGPCRSCR